MKRLTALLISLGFLAFAGPAASITPPTTGAVAKPTDFQISVPFEDGERVKVISGYSPSGGSSLHAGTNETGKANDYYALDLTLPDHPNHGYGQPILAIADGEVVKAGWGTQGWAAYGQRVIIRHVHNGVTFHSLYAHMSSITVSEGDVIQQGTQVGALGGSCNGASSCSNFSTPHLHFALHEDSNIGGSGSGGSYGGNAVVPELMDGQGDITRYDILQSQNDGSGQVVDPCLVATGETKIIDDRSPCFDRITDYWWDESGGYDNHWYYTKAIDASQSDTVGTWNFSFESSGDYEIEVHIPSGAQSQQAKYYIGVGGNELPAIQLDQSSVTGWQTLDTVNFGQGDGHYLRLPDNTGEALSLDRKIAFDAIRISPGTTGGDTGTPDAGGDTGTADTGTADAGTADTGVGPDTGQPDAGTPDSGGADTGSDDMDAGTVDSGSCADCDKSDGLPDDSSGGSSATSGTGSCSTGTGMPSLPALLLVVFVGLGLWRRRH